MTATTPRASPSATGGRFRHVSAMHDAEALQEQLAADGNGSRVTEPDPVDRPGDATDSHDPAQVADSGWCWP